MENVMLNSIHTQLKIVDFGLSNIFNPENPLRTHCGSPEYAAPELFVAGRHYGPEVDLWSLGVILYGMVVGQLPFVTSRTEHVPSPERRKRLLAQINKGLATPHRKALAAMSSEFRAMMARLLIADSTKRITVKELLFHPWVTEKGIKGIRSNPMKKLEDHYHRRIVFDLGKMLHTDSDNIQRSIAEEKQGNVSGMYNILVYKQQMQRLDGDGITKTLPPTAPTYGTPRPQSSYENKLKPSLTQNTKRVDPVKSAPAHRNHIMNFAEDFNFKIEETKQYQRPSTSSGKRQPETMPVTEMRASSATVGNRIPKSPLVKGTMVKEKGKCSPRESMSVQSPLRVERPSTPVELVCGDMMGEEVKTPVLRKASERPHTPRVPPRPSSKSEPLNNECRRQTPTGPPVHTAERALKRRSMLPVVATQSSPNRGTNADEKSTTAPRTKRVTSSKIPICLEKSMYGTGDCKRPSTTPGIDIAKPHVINTKKMPLVSSPPISKPIARTIAEYVSSNPARLKAFKLLKSPPQTNKGYFNP